MRKTRKMSQREDVQEVEKPVGEVKKPVGAKGKKRRATAEPVSKEWVTRQLSAAGCELLDVQGEGDCFFLAVLLAMGRINQQQAQQPDGAATRAVQAFRNKCCSMMMTEAGRTDWLPAEVPAEVLRASEKLNIWQKTQNLTDFQKLRHWAHPTDHGGERVSASVTLYTALALGVQVAVFEEEETGSAGQVKCFKGAARVYGARDEQGRVATKEEAVTVKEGGKKVTKTLWTVPTYLEVPVQRVLEQAGQAPGGWVLLLFVNRCHYMAWVETARTDEGGASNMAMVAPPVTPVAPKSERKGRQQKGRQRGAEVGVAGVNPYQPPPGGGQPPGGMTAAWMTPAQLEEEK